MRLLVRVDGRLTVRRIDPPPSLKKPASSSKDEVRAEISDMGRHQLLPAMAEKFLPGQRRDAATQAARKAD
jgi:hypothetical protein